MIKKQALDDWVSDENSVRLQGEYQAVKRCEKIYFEVPDWYKLELRRYRKGVGITLLLGGYGAVWP